jgi:two-component system sensor histidine kinase KdpD
VDGLLDTASQHIADVFPGQLAVLLPGEDGRVTPRRVHPAEFSMDESELAVAHWVYQHRQLAGLGTATLPGARALYLPLVGSRGAVGVLGMSPADAHALESPEQLHQLETFANQMALAIERAQVSEDARRAEVRAEAERLRNSLLSSVSHDLRTPLASITGAASSLLESGDQLGDATRKELLSSIHQEAERLDRLVNNLLEMTRLEAGVVIRKEWQPLEGVLGAALKRLEERLRDREVHIDLPGDLPLVPFDAVLVEQVLINVLENAAKYTPAGSAIDISAATVGGAVRVDIADHGPGFATGEEERCVRQVLPKPRREGPRRRARPRDLAGHHRGARREDLGRAAGRRRRRLPLRAANRRRSTRGTSRRSMRPVPARPRRRCPSRFGPENPEALLRFGYPHTSASRGSTSSSSTCR